MTMNMVITSVLILLALFFIGTWIYIYLRDKTLQEIRTDVYDLFLKAEHRFTESKAGKQKMKWVISEGRKLLPVWLQMLVTDKLLYSVFEEWFRAVKDLLDDGKYNKSV